MTFKNVYPIIVHNDYDVECAYEWLNRQSTQIFGFTGVKFVPSYYRLKTEDEILYSYAAAKFQHLMVL